MANFFQKYEILGDSNMVRFLAHISARKPPKNSHGANYFGLAVSGQGLRSLIRRVKMNPPKSKNILIMIGTNDVRKNKHIRHCSLLIHVLKKQLANKNVVWLTVPPMPFFSSEDPQSELQIKYNKIIKRLKNVCVLDVDRTLRTMGGLPNRVLFEKTYRRAKSSQHRKMDLIHLNKFGLTVLHQFLMANLPPEEEMALVYSPDTSLLK